MNYPIEDAPALLELARQDAGLTQKELAERSGIHQPVISAIERGRRRVSHATLSRLLTFAQLRPSVPLEFYADTVRVFGSMIRGHDTPDSDVDLLVTLSPHASLFDLAGFRQEAELIIGFPVDVIPDDAQNPVVEGALIEAVPL